MPFLLALGKDQGCVTPARSCRGVLDCIKAAVNTLISVYLEAAASSAVALMS